MTAHRQRASDGRWHFQHGPIDLIIEADGDASAVASAHASAWSRFTTILDELVAELPWLRMPLPAASRVASRFRQKSSDRAVDGGLTGGIDPSIDHAIRATLRPRGVVARRMWDACLPHRARFVTPMAAVAGAVADELIEPYRRSGIRRAWINNGGDIALHLEPGAVCRVGLFADLARFRPSHAMHGIDMDAHFEVTHTMPVRGIATSGWRGRSFSLGIADSVTVLACDAATADAAATMIANAVNVEDARIVRRPASTLKDDSDLGERLVTVDVPKLDTASVRRALSSGLAHAEALQADGVIVSCMLVCQGVMAVTDRSGAVSRMAIGSDAWHATRLRDEIREAIA